jgi:hypothetical protein
MDMETIEAEPAQGEVTRDSMGNRFWFVPKDKGGIIRRGSTMRAPTV